MGRNLVEPSAVYWTIGILASLALHASGVAGAVLLADRYVQSAPPTEITFSDEASPVAAPLPSETEVAAVSESAIAQEHETLAPATPDPAANPASETLQPLETETAQTAQRETLTPSSAESAVSVATETVVPTQTEVAAVSETEQISTPVSEVSQVSRSEPEAAQPVESADAPAADTPASLQPQSVVETPVEGIDPAATPQALPEGPSETATAIYESDSFAASGNSDRVVSSTPSSTVSGEVPETIAAVETSTGVVPPASNEQPVATSIPAENLVPEVATAPSVGETLQPVTSVPPETSGLQPTGTGPISTAPVQPEALSPVTGSSDTGGESVGVVPAQPEVIAPTVEIPGAGPETVQPVEEPLETALLVPARPDSSLGTEVDKPTDRYRRIVDFVRQYSGGDCFIALPAMSPGGEVTFQTFGRDKQREDAFKQALLGLDGLRAEISSGDVADPQCLALSFARAAKRYPGFSLMIDLDEADFASGGSLSGSVLNAGDRELHLLLVDDEGKVQSLDRFLGSGGGTDRHFGTPLTLTGGRAVETKQILVAIATDRPLPALAGPINQPADIYFAKLEKEIDATDADVDLAVEGFNVR